MTLAPGPWSKYFSSFNAYYCEKAKFTPYIGALQAV